MESVLILLGNIVRVILIVGILRYANQENVLMFVQKDCVHILKFVNKENALTLQALA